MPVVEADVEYEKSTLRSQCKQTSCDSNLFRIVEREKHYAEQKCVNCGSHQKFIPDPNKDERTRSTRFSISDLLDNRGYDTAKCFFCRRPSHQLGQREGLELDHIKEIAREDGEDRLNNLQILCTACHKLKNWMRTYHNVHMQHLHEGNSQ